MPRNKYYLENVLPKRIHLNGNTKGFHPGTQKLELHTKQKVTCESTAEEVSFNTEVFRPQTQKLKLRTK